MIIGTGILAVIVMTLALVIGSEKWEEFQI
jgi:hypothetical protein